MIYTDIFYSFSGSCEKKAADRNPLNQAFSMTVILLPKR